MSEGHPATTAPVPAELRRAPGPTACLAAPPGDAAARELWLAAYFPRLPLEALLPMAGDARAAGVIEASDPRHCLLACSDRAVRQGVAVGMGLNAALVLAPGLKLHERRPAAEAALLDRLARWVLQFTPVVSIEPPAALLAEVRGSLGLFGGAIALCRRAEAGLRARGLRANVALAPTPRGALWLARAGIRIAAVRADAMPGLAAQLPLACLEWPADVIGTLARLGIRNVADLVRLPRDGFARRFGQARLDELDEGLGRRRQPRRRHVVPERFDERLELPVEAGSTAQLEPAAEQLLAALGAF
ncbi:MAG: DNA polymerase Y family protein, partial [Gammaproteobacteria bacterium]|nr:DNA polymerase Y family protein [Gammaproteobacteria bacterium]